VRGRVERAVAVAEQHVAGTRGKVGRTIVVEIRRDHEPRIRAGGISPGRGEAGQATVVEGLDAQSVRAGHGNGSSHESVCGTMRGTSRGADHGAGTEPGRWGACLAERPLRPPGFTRGPDVRARSSLLTRLLPFARQA